MLPVHLVSEYRGYDVKHGLEFHLTGTMVTRQELEEHTGLQFNVKKLERIHETIF